MLQIILIPNGEICPPQRTGLNELHKLCQPLHTQGANDVFNPAGIFFRGFLVNAQSLRKESGQRIMAANHIAGNLVTFGSKSDVAISLMLYKCLFRESLQGVGNTGHLNSQLSADLTYPHYLPPSTKVSYRLKVVLHTRGLLPLRFLPYHSPLHKLLDMSNNYILMHFSCQEAVGLPQNGNSY